jgi:rSAM/selenodomain-associated transferase 2
MLSAVIPTLNAAGELRPTLSALKRGRGADLVAEVIVADGGSSDGTLDVAREAGCRIVEAPRGRGAQLRVGGDAAQGDWLLFIHADTRLDDTWSDDAASFMADPANGTRAAAFAFKLDDDRFEARVLERIVAVRTRLLALPYGDQGLLLSRDFYRRLGGYRAMPLMEDVDMVRRIGRRRLRPLRSAAVTSAARYRRDGYVGRSLRNLGCLTLYALGVPPHVLARLYG